MRIFQWRSKQPGLPDAGQLGHASMALRVERDSVIPDACIGICLDQHGRARHFAAGQTMPLGAHERAYWLHVGPYTCDLIAYAATPEIGLRLQFVLDAPDPRVAQQRFDLFLASEIEADLSLDDVATALQTCLQDALLTGALTLAACATHDEWMLFRAGLDQLMYTRFGLTVDECMLVDLGDEIDYAQVLRQRVEDAGLETSGVSGLREPVWGQPAPARASAATHTYTTHAPPPSPPQRDADTHTPASPRRADAPIRAAARHARDTAHTVAQRDAFALRRLFLELPSLCSGLRQIALPPGQTLFRQRQDLLQRFDLLSLRASTMPALEWAGPDHALDAQQQARRLSPTLRALQGLDEAWALLACLQQCQPEGSTQPQQPPQPDPLAQYFDDADRILANMESNLAARAQAFSSVGEPS
jgi:hypothetical protein